MPCCNFDNYYTCIGISSSSWYSLVFVAKKTATPINKMDTSIQQEHVIHNYNQSDDVLQKVHINT